MLNGIFGEGELRHIAYWQSRKYTVSWQEEDESANVRHTREYFTHECTLLWAQGLTQVLTHEAQTEQEDEGNDPNQSGPEFTQPRPDGSRPANGSKRSNVVVMTPRDS
jgi:hypothetical protein